MNIEDSGYVVRVIGYVILAQIVLIMIAFLEGNFINGDLGVDMAHDIGIYGIHVMIIIILLFQKQYHKRFKQVFVSLMDNHIVEYKDEVHLAAEG